MIGGIITEANMLDEDFVKIESNVYSKTTEIDGFVIAVVIVKMNERHEWKCTIDTPLGRHEL